MHLVFNAQEVDYSEALGGDLVQASFQEKPVPYIDYSKKNHPLPPPIKSVVFSANYEFSSKIKVEWCDGEEFDGGESIRELKLTSSMLKLVLTNGFSFAVSFKTNDFTFQNIKSFLLSGSK
jgi:hypothetical protein